MARSPKPAARPLVATKLRVYSKPSSAAFLTSLHISAIVLPCAAAMVNVVETGTNTSNMVFSPTFDLPRIIMLCTP